MAQDVVARPDVERLPVSGRDALFRSATGFGVSVAIVSFVALVWPDAVELALSSILISSVGWLHESKDHRHRVAAVVSGGLSAVVALGAVILLGGGPPDFSRDVACAALGVLAGSQIYAAITRR
ncbi:hypothetical protein AB0C01_06955 [Micromonospora sp. NPDC048905]|uniref:hypothetical protein n=1 Tax=Micromonospora sp. NPDC048905 TaxID=3155494 RepID=UPI0033DEAD9F